VSPSAPASDAMRGVTALPRTRWWVANYYVLAALSGLRSVDPWSQPLIDLSLPLATNLVMAGWAIRDGRRRQRSIPFLSRDWLFIFANVAVPLYLIVTRGWRGVGWVLLHGIAWWIVYAVAESVGFAAVYG